MLSINVVLGLIFSSVCIKYSGLDVIREVKVGELGVYGFFYLYSKWEVSFGYFLYKVLNIKIFYKIDK